MTSRANGELRRETANLASAADDIDTGWEEAPESVIVPQRRTEPVSAPLSSLPPVTSVPRPRSSTRELADGPTLEIQEIAFEGEDAVRRIGEAFDSYPSIEVCESENDDLGDLACEIDALER